MTQKTPRRSSPPHASTGGERLGPARWFARVASSALVAAAIAVLGVLGMNGPAAAQFAASGVAASQGVSSAVLPAPAGLAGSAVCSTPGSVVVDVSWAPSNGLDSDGNYLVGYYGVYMTSAGGPAAKIGSVDGAPSPSSLAVTVPHSCTSPLALEVQAAQTTSGGGFVSQFSSPLVLTPSSPPTTTTTTAATGSCSAGYQVTSQWPGGFNWVVTVTDTGSAPISGWTVAWTYADGQTVQGAYNADVSQSGAAVTASNKSYDGSLGAGSSTQFGGGGTWSGTNSVPSPTCTPVTASTVSGSCSASYQVTSQWSGGFNWVVTVTDTGSAPITGWTVAWTYADGQTVHGAYNADVSQSGAAVTASNKSYDGSLGAGASTQFGGGGTWSGTNTVPALTCR